MGAILAFAARFGLLILATARTIALFAFTAGLMIGMLKGITAIFRGIGGLVSKTKDRAKEAVEEKASETKKAADVTENAEEPVTA